MTCIVEFAVAAAAVCLAAPQELSVRGVRVVTGTDAKWSDPGVAVSDGRILPETAPASPRAASLDFSGGGFVFPGMVDAHGHLLELGDSLRQVDLVGTTSLAEVVDRVRARASELPKGTWILGRGWDQNDWSESAFPDHYELSSSVPDHPVLLTRIDGHALLANWAAMQAAGVDAKTESPSGGEIVREDDGAPTGVFVDNAMALIGAHVPSPTDAEIQSSLLLAQSHCLARGITCVHDAGMEPRTLRILRELHTAGRWVLRVYVMLPAAATDEIRKGPWQTPDRVITVRAVKGYADGALGSRGAAMLEPYSDRDGWRGLMITPAAGLRQLAQLCATYGFQLCVHAIGDRANREVLDAYAATEFPDSLRKARFRVEHAQVVHPDDFARFDELGVIPSMQPTHLTSDMPWAPTRLGAERVAGAYAWRSFLDLGLPLTFGSDFPVERADPLLGWHAAATTRPPRGGDELRPDQKLSRAEILRGFTANAAYASFSERDCGTIEAGKYADFTIYDRDLMTCPDEDFEQVSVLATVIGGQVAYLADGVGRPHAPTSPRQVQTVLEAIAGDDLEGRDSPSLGLDRAATVIASGLAKVGVRTSGDQGTYFQHYTVPGLEVDSAQLSVKLVDADGNEVELRPNRDVRVWRPGRPFKERTFESEVKPTGRLNWRRSSTPELMLCDENSPVWRTAAGRRSVIARGTPGAAPVLLIRDGAVAAGKVTATVTSPSPKRTDIELRNLVGVAPGTDLADEYVLITAHYDHVGVRPTEGGDVIFNGADDNATGATAVLLLAQALSRGDIRLKRSLMFVFFSAEEKGLLGSRAFVERPPIPLESISAVFNLEMLGRPADGKKNYVWVTGDDLSDFATILDPVLTRRGIERIDFPMADRLFAASDNLPFARAGVVAHSISAGELHGDYHRPGDEVAKIDFGHMAAVIDGLRDCVIEMANREGRPSWNDKGRQKLNLEKR